MTCGGCATGVRLGLLSLPGVEDVDVDVEGNKVMVVGRSVDPSSVRARIEELGYTTAATADEATPRRSASRGLVVGAVALALIFLIGTVVFARVVDAYLEPGNVAAVNEWFAGASLARVILAFIFGVVVGFAPSTYAMAPAVAGYAAPARSRSRRDGLRFTAAFIVGMVVIDVIVGGLFAAFGRAALSFFGDRLALWYGLVTIVLLVLAAINLGLWRPSFPGMRSALRAPTSARGAFLLGVPFGLLTCPACTPLLLPVALGAAASANIWYGGLLLGAFALGRGIPLGVLAAFPLVITSGKGGAFVGRVQQLVGVALAIAAAFFFIEFLMLGPFDGIF